MELRKAVRSQRICVLGRTLTAWLLENVENNKNLYSLDGC